MATEQIGVAIQGAGWVSTEHIRAYQQNPYARVVAVGSRTLAGARAKAAECGLDVATYDDFDELLANPDVDVVSICTPPSRHAEETVRAAAAGKHILIEKPVATTPDELYRMRDAVRAAGVRTVVSFVLRWNPAVLNIKALKADGALGDTFYVQTDYWHNVVQAGLRGKGGAEGIMLGGGCHAMDAARYLMDSDIVQVTAQSWGELPAQPHVGADDTVALVRFANGGMGKVSACSTQWMPYNFNLDVFGTEGVVRGDRFYAKKLPGLTGFGQLTTVLPDSGDVSHHPFAGEINHLIECVREGRESHVNLDDAVNTHEACFAADLSAKAGGEPIRLPLALPS